MENLDLPLGWVETTLGEATLLKSGFGFPKEMQGKTEGQYPFIKVSDISNAVKNGEMYISSAENYISEEDRINLKAKIAEKGTTVFAKIGEGLKLNRRIILYQDSIIDNNTIGICPINPISENFIFYFLKTIQLETLAISTVVPSVRASDIEKIILPLPPLAEQHRIVAEIEKVMAWVSATQEELDKIPALMRAFRQKVLAMAVSGELTVDFRVSHKITKNWDEKTLIDVITEKPKNGYSAKPVFYETAFKVLTLTSTTSGEFIDGHFKYFDDKIEINPNLWVKPDDILIQRGNTIDYVGVSAIYEGEVQKYIYPDLMIRIRANEKVITKFLHYCLSNVKARNYLRDRATGTSGNMPKINQPTLCSLPVLVPSIAEQTEIVRRVEELFAWCDSVEAAYTEGVEKLKILPQSLLQKAFSGKLVSQDPNDEPASVLLERIKVEKTRLSETSKQNKIDNRKIKQRFMKIMPVV